MYLHCALVDVALAGTCMYIVMTTTADAGDFDTFCEEDTLQCLYVILHICMLDGCCVLFELHLINSKILMNGTSWAFQGGCLNAVG